MLPRMDGWRLIEAARAEGLGTPIIVVSARGTEHDRVHALEIGADDYLVKPFSMKELVARVQRRVAARWARAVRGARRSDRDRGAPHRPAQRPGLPRRSERRPDADRVPAALRPRARARPGRQPRRAAPEALGPPRGPSRPHRRRLRAQAARQDRPPGAAAHVHPDALRRRLQAGAGTEGLGGFGGITPHSSSEEHPDCRTSAHQKREDVRGDACTAGVTATRDHRGMLAVLPGDLTHAPGPNRLHGLIVSAAELDISIPFNTIFHRYDELAGDRLLRPARESLLSPTKRPRQPHRFSRRSLTRLE